MNAPDLFALYCAMPEAERREFDKLRGLHAGPAARRAAADNRSWCVEQMLSLDLTGELRHGSKVSWVAVHARVRSYLDHGVKPPWSNWQVLRRRDWDVSPRALMKAYHRWRRRRGA